MGPKNTSGYRLFLLSILAIALSACGGGGGGEGSGSGGSGGSGGALEIKILAANDGTNGTELWKTDGTAAGTVLVKNINTTAPGSSSSPSRFTEFNGATYFSADDGVNGFELWKTDGTAAGTVLVKDINPAKWPITGAGVNSNPSGFTELNGALYFQANGSRSPPHMVENYELWKTDGTAAGTMLVYNITASTGASTRLSAFTVFNGALYFTADDGPSGTELWKTDGTAAGTLLVKNINTLGIGASAFPNDFTVFNGALYFTADDGVNGRELWKTDGTDAGTVMVTAINAGAVGGLPGGFTVFDGALYFGALAFDDVNGFALWKTDGTTAGTVLVKSGSYYPSGFTVLNGTLYFRFVQTSIAPFCGGGLNNFELWKTDGTAAGTVMVKNFNTTPGVCSILSVFTEFNGALYFNANDGVQGSQQGEHGELWKSDGTAAGTVLVKDINPSAAETPSPDSSLFVLNGALYLKALDSVNGIELWKSDGSAAGTQLLKDICPGACSGTMGF